MNKANQDEPQKPRFLNEEQRHNRYSVEMAEKHYKNKVYYRQRKGGNGWFHGRTSRAYRNNYDNIFKKEKQDGLA